MRLYKVVVKHILEAMVVKHFFTRSCRDALETLLALVDDACFE